MDEELDEFDVSPDASASADQVFEGTNASRFAVAGALGANGAGAADPTLGVVEPDMLAMFGFNPEPGFFTEQLRGDVETAVREANYLIERFSDEWNANGARNGAWNALREQTPLARLALLAAGLCSPLEREGTAAAVALVNAIPAAIQSDLLRPGFRDVSFLRRPFPRLEWWQGEWPGFVPDVFDPEDIDSDYLLDGAFPWGGAEWYDFSNRTIQLALGPREPYLLLSTLLALAYWRIAAARRSSDSVVRGLAEALRFRRSPARQTEELRGPQQPPPTLAPAGAVSTIVHGTWAWEGDWWLPGGQFYDYIQARHLLNLYGGGAEFSWSGAYKKSHRRTAGYRFKRWAEGISPRTPLHTVFAHSYGAEVAARAVNDGAQIGRLVFLSAPIGNPHRYALDRTAKIIDIRLKFDIVLTLAQRKQRLPSHPRLTELIINRAFWQHSVTYNTQLWDDEHIATKVGL